MLVTEIDIVGVPSNACDGLPIVKIALKKQLFSVAYQFKKKQQQ